MNIIRVLLLPTLTAVLFSSGIAHSAVARDDEVLASNQYSTVTYADYRHEIELLPEQYRASFALAPPRVTTLLDSLLVRKSLAKEALRLNLAPVSGPPEASMDRRLEQAWIEHVEQAAGASFDERTDDFLPRARELYLLDPQRYAAPEQIVVSHIAFSIDKRGEEAALQAAQAARAEITAGKDFETVAAERSDAPDGSGNRGRLPAVTRTNADPLLWAVAAKLSPGDVSEPVSAGTMIELIKLVERVPAKPRTFEEAKPLIFAEIRAKYVNDERELALGKFRDTFKTELNQAAINALFAEAPSDSLRPRR